MAESRFFIVSGIISSLILGLILFLCSYSIVDINKYGIVYNKNTQKIVTSEPTYKSGRYLLGLGRKFILFPRGYIQLYFSDGQDKA